MAELKQLTKYVLQQENLELIEQWMGIQPVVEHMIPSGPLVNVYVTMENHHFKWENSL